MFPSYSQRLKFLHPSRRFRPIPRPHTLSQTTPTTPTPQRSKSKRTYRCDCTHLCNEPDGKIVSERTWFRHAEYRANDKDRHRREQKRRRLDCADSVVCVSETVPDTGGGDIAPEAERQAGSDEHGRLDSGASDRTASEVPAILTARLLALRSPSGPTPASTTSASGPASIKKKQPNNTLSAKNLFLIDYYKANDPISNDEFKERWDSLPPDQKKKWEVTSQEARKVKKAAENVSE